MASSAVSSSTSRTWVRVTTRSSGPPCSPCAPPRRAAFASSFLDRPNPLGSDPQVIEGKNQEDAYRSFVGLEPLPIRHGLTLGEVVAWRAHAEGRPARAARGAHGEGPRPFRARARVGSTVRQCPLAQHALVRDGARLPGRLPARGDESLGRARHDPSVRDHGRPVVGWRAAREGVQRSRRVGGAGETGHLHTHVPQARETGVRWRADPRHRPARVSPRSGLRAAHRDGVPAGHESLPAFEPSATSSSTTFRRSIC